MDEKLKILLCEDDENLGMLLREYLAAKGYEAELCPDGEAGFKAFLKTKFDICVLDVMMPKKDGFTLAQEIRTANAEIPIIFLTANICAWSAAANARRKAPFAQAIPQPLSNTLTAPSAIFCLPPARRSFPLFPG